MTFAYFFIFVPVVFYIIILVLRTMYTHFFVPFIILFSISAIFGTLFFILAVYLFWRFVLGNFALKYRPSLIPYFFRNKKDVKSFAVIENYFLGKYYFDRANYEQAENYFTTALNSFFSKKITLDKFKSESRPYDKEEVKKKVDKLYEENSDFTAFFKTIKLYFLQFINIAAKGIDYFILEQQPIIYFIKTRKITSPKYNFLHDFDEDEKCFTENKKHSFEDNNLTKEQRAGQHLNSIFKGSVDLRCIEAKLMLECNEYVYYEKSLEISNEIVDIVEKSTNQTILWRLLYVRGCAYHKLGNADLACQDWKRGIELGDVEFCQKMYNENCNK
jgi:tetratricopeptide (TPR) repeat protein